MNDYFLKFKETVASDRNTVNIPALRDRNATSIQVNVSSTLSATISLQQSVDGVNFATLSEQTARDVTNTPTIFNVAGNSPRFYRIAFTAVTGSGEVEVWLS
jgi:hypothetical protein